MHCLDRQASIIWALCDGERDTDGIVTAAAGVFGVEAAAVRADVVSTVATFKELGLLR